jgi:hypothetical protein
MSTCFAGGAGREDFFGGSDVPGVGGLAHEERDDELVDGGVVERLAALAAEEDGDGDAPDALPGDAPVGASGDHVGDPFLAPGGVPFDGFDFVEGALAEGGDRRQPQVLRLRPVRLACGSLRGSAQDDTFRRRGGHGGVHGDEPLLGGADDDGVVAAPAVRVGVLEAGRGEQRAFFLQQFDDDGVGFEDGEAFVGLGLVAAEALGVHLAAGVVDILDFGQVVALAGGEVVDAVGGRGVDGAGALVGGDVGGVDAEDGAVEEWMLEGGAVERGAFEEGEDVGLRRGLGWVGGAHQMRVDDDFGEQGLGDDVDGAGRLRATYSISGWKATARDAGRVQGVVVQMMV